MATVISTSASSAVAAGDAEQDALLPHPLEIAREALLLSVEADAVTQQRAVQRLFGSAACPSGPGVCPSRGARPFNPIDFNSFRDRTLEIVKTVRAGSRVIAYLRFDGTHVGPFDGHAPSGRRMSADGLVVFDVEDGQIVRGCRLLRWS